MSVVVPEPRRLYVIALVAGLLIDLAVATVVFVGGTAFQPLGVLIFVGAIVLGFSFGALPGLIGAAVPPFVLFAAEAVRRTTDPHPGPSVGTELLYVAVVAAFVGFLAWFCGSIRDRYLLGR